jgi:hypothetical protein
VGTAFLWQSCWEVTSSDTIRTDHVLNDITALGNMAGTSGLKMEQVRFAIVFVGRQGSTYVERLLDSHPDISCRGEIYAPSVFTKYGVDAVEAHLLTQVHARSSKAVGFKLSIQDLMNHPELLSIVKKYNYKAIRLTRNLLDQYLSMELAIANNSWTSDDPSRGITQVKGTPERLQANFRMHYYCNTILKEATETMLAIDVSYEEVVREETHAVILSFLGARVMPLQPATVRQRLGSQRQSLQNYDEMKAYFAETRWASEFLE